MTAATNIKDLTPEQKRALLREMVARKSAERKTWPLSRNQQRLWLWDRLDPGNPAHNMHQAYRVRGSLDGAALQRAIDALTVRHEALRTVFREEDGAPVQEPRAEMPMPLIHRDFSDLPAEERLAQAQAFAIEENRKPFDLAQGPLCRFMLLRLAEDDCILVFAMHHIITDQRSYEVFNEELAQLYGAFVSGNDSPLAPPPAQPKDLVVLERRNEARFREGLDAWKARLQGVSPTELPTDRPRPAEQRYRGVAHVFEMDLGLMAKIGRLSESLELSLSMIYMALFQTLLHRETGQTDISCGNPATNRERIEAQRAIGFFVNTLVVRGDFSGQPSFRQVIERFKDFCRVFYGYPNTPFDLVVRELHQGPDLSRNPLYQILFQRGVLPKLNLPGLSATRAFEMDLGVVRSDLEFFIMDEADAFRGMADAFRGMIVYNRELFYPETIQALGERFHMLARWIADHPDTPVAHAPLLSEVEKGLLLHEWNDTRKPYERDVCMHQLFERRAAAAPERPAAACDGDALTYGELNARANRLAHELIARGVGPEILVGVCCPRSLDMLTAVLAIQKAGGAYVPMEPDWPADRIAYVLGDIAAPAVLTHRALEAKLAGAPAPAIYLDEDDFADRPAGDPSARAEADNTAYIIFTSGSTGRPKGVIIRHHTAINLIEWVNQSFHVGPDDRLLFTTSLCFDLSVYDIFGVLAAGGEVLVAAEDEVKDPVKLTGLLQNRGVTFWDSAPAALMQLTPFFPEAGAGSPDLRLVFLSGDWIPLSLPPAVRQAFPNARVIGLGGATEATIWSNFWPVEAIDPDWKSVPYGRPIQNARYYILDRRLTPAPINTPGDLFIADDCLSYGYFNRPDLTAERYVPDPFSDRAGAFMYNTGDRARWRRAGYMEFLGRLDAQVKIRGFRIELGEIESALMDQPSVREAVALAREDRPGDKRLAVYVQPEPGAAPTAAELADALAERLPEYMMPAAYVFLAQWPVTPNGKLDRKALPAPEYAAEAGARRAPRNSVEQELADIWRDLLDLDAIGVADNFFDLGGHSLTAAQTAARIRKAFGVDVPVRLMFTQNTVEKLAKTIAGLQEQKQRGLEPIPRQTGEPERRLAFSQERLWYFGQLAPESSVYNQPFSVRLRGPLDVDAMDRAFRLIVDRHEPLRTLFLIEDGQPMAAVGPVGAFRLPLIDAADSPAEGDGLRRRLTQAAFENPFRLDERPGFRVALLRTGPEDHALLLCLHHIISDGWSAGMLILELTAAYSALVGGCQPDLPDLSIRYSDYVAWTRHPDRDKEAAAQLAYWREKLKGEPPVLQLPSDRPRPADFRFHGRNLYFDLSAELMNRVRARCAREDVTPFMFLLAAMNIMLYRYSGQRDIWIGSPVANRKRLETEPMVGLFFNTIVFRADLTGAPTVRELLGRVRETALGAYEHEDMTFERLVEALNPERALSHNPLFQAMFALQHTPVPDPELPGLACQQLGVDNHSAKFDLIFDLADMPGAAGPVGLRGRIEYNTDLFDEATILRMTRHFERTLTGMEADPGQAIDDLPFLDEAERRQLTLGWNDTAAPYSRELCLHQPFERQARQAPAAPALEHDGRVLAYGALNRCANRIARLLIARGVRPGDLVGVRMRRCEDMVAALLGIHKAGAAYVPMDPRFPADRVAYIMADTGAKLLLTQSALADSAPEPAERNVLLDRVDLAAYDDGDLDLTLDAGTLAYIIFTSGSTGKPKGVVLQHRPVINLIEWVNQTFSVGPGDRLLFVTSLCFDLSVYDIFGTLAAGGTVVIPTEEETGDARALAALLNEKDITFWDSAPAALHQLTPLLPESGSPKLRLVFLSGDWIPLSLPPLMQNVFPNVRVIGLGGATEAAIWSNFFPIGAIEKEWRSVPYGRPIQNAAYLILDARLQPCPVNAPGDLYIGGECLSAGYFDQPALTAERYLPDPFSRRPGAVIYRTGDRARFFADGNIEFLGRLDAQVKIRGFRIELGEIEAALNDAPEVAEAVALAREDKPGEKRLVAYVQLKAGTALDAAALSERLGRSLPDYMIPSAYVAISSWPLTANGKLDRKALPAPDVAAESKRYAPPRTSSEQALAAIWEETLGVDRVGVHDNYFELGGDSILSIRIIARARKAGYELTPQQFFQCQTVAAMAAVLGDASEGRAQEGLPEVSEEPFKPLSASQQGLWLLSQIHADRPLYNVDFCLELRGELNRAALAGALADAVRRHDILRARFVVRQGQPWRAADDQVAPQLETRDLSAIADQPERLRQALQEDLSRPFVLDRDPLLRLTLYRLDDNRHWLAYAAHHLITDGVSIQAFFAELSRRYNVRLEGASVPEPRPRRQYDAFVRWQRRWLAGDACREQTDFWRERLRDCPVRSMLPPDLSAPAKLSANGAVIVRPVEAELTARLRAFVAREETTLFAALLTGFYAAARRRAGQDHLVIGTDVSNRGLPETQDMQGLFINQAPLAMQAEGQTALREIMARARDAVAEALVRQDLPFDRIVEALGLSRDPAASPLCQMKFGLNRMARPPRFAGLEAKVTETPRETAQIELNLNMTEFGDVLYFHLNYNTDLYRRESMDALCDEIEQALTALCDQPDMRLSQATALLDARAAERESARRDQRNKAALDRLGKTRRRTAATAR